VRARWGWIDLGAMTLISVSAISQNDQPSSNLPSRRECHLLMLSTILEENSCPVWSAGIVLISDTNRNPSRHVSPRPVVYERVYSGDPNIFPLPDAFWKKNAPPKQASLFNNVSSAHISRDISYRFIEGFSGDDRSGTHKWSDEQLCGNVDMVGDRFPAVFNVCFVGNMNSVRIENQGFEGLNIAIDGDPRASVGLHFIQLPLHDVKLTPEYARSDYPYDHQGSGEPADMAGPSRHHSFVDLMLACGSFAATAAAVFVSFKSAEYADNHRFTRPWWWVPALGFLALAFWFAHHGLSFLAAPDRIL
jgi:hypothetical protein